MAVAFRVVYSLAVAIVFVLFVVFGMRTFYGEPERPVYPTPGRTVSYDAWERDRADHRRNVFIVSTVIGVAAIAAGLFLYRRVEAIPLGFLVGGLGIVVYGWAQAVDDLGEIGPGPLFATTGAAFLVLLVTGYSFLGLRAPPSGKG